MLDFLRIGRNEISEYIGRYMAAKIEIPALASHWGIDVFERLRDFILRGKMIRGMLVSFGSELGCPGGKRRANPVAADVLKAACAMELFQSGLLIHDDIMDRDPVRRGIPSIHTQYSTVSGMDIRDDALHFGESMGINAGNLMYFCGFEQLSGLAVSRKDLARITAFCARELTVVGIAQMHDVHGGVRKDPVNEDELFFIYRHKTGRYSFSLPLVMGAILTGAPEELVLLLDSIGEDLGILFQVKDDELGLFGSSVEIGKPVGSDVREGKKTLYYLKIMKRASASEIAGLRKIFGNRDVSETDIEYVRDLTESLGVRKEIDRMMTAIKERVSVEIDGADCLDESGRDLLRNFVAELAARYR